MTLDVYQHLLLINSAFDQVVRSLVALRKHRRFHGAELNRFRRQSNETRASVNSYLTAIIESAETEAGRRFRRRIAQEKLAEEGGPQD